MMSMVPDPNIRQGPLPAIKPTPSIIQAAPTVYSAPPAPSGHKRNDVRAQRQARMVLSFLLIFTKKSVKFTTFERLLCACCSITV